MRDLYTAIGVACDTNMQQIADAIAGRSGDIYDRARHILLDPQRRAAYDQAYKATLIVASIRRSLVLDETRRWMDSETSEWQQQGQLAYPIQLTLLRTGRLSVRMLRRWINRNTTPTQRVVAAVIAFVLFLVAVSYFSDSTGAGSRNGGASGYSGGDATGLTPVARPYHNELFISRGTSEGLLEINTSIGSDYYIKLVDVYDRRIARSFYLYGGSTGRIELPRGSYLMLINQGSTWYGPQLGFGPSSSRSRIQDEIRIVPSDESYLVITLQGVQNGNLRSEGISSSEFDEYE